MLARFALILTLIPAVALAADGAAPLSNRITVPTPQPAAAAPAPKPAAKAPVLVSTAPAPQDGGECRTGCAQTEYFCQAGDHPESCSDGWSQCVASCNSPNLAPAVSTGP